MGRVCQIKALAVNGLNPNYAQEAKPTNALAQILGLEIGFNPDLATLGFHQKGFS
jgi:hypothetical protein